MITVYALLLAFRWAIIVSIPSCVLILLILLIKKVFDKKLSAPFHYYIWFLLIIRLVIPYIPQSPASALNLFSPLYNMVQSSEVSAVNSASTDTQSNAGKASKKVQRQHIYSKLGNTNGINKNANATFSYNSLELSLAGIWFCGILFYIAYVLISNRRFNIKLKGSEPVSEERVQEIYGKCKSVLNVGCNIPVLYTEAVGTPSIYGILHPKFLLPKKLTDRLNDKELEYVFLHELAHYKRKDIQVIFAVTLIKAFYWFNPFIWYAFYRMRMDCENSCDAMVMSHINTEEHTGYGYLLIHLLELRAPSKSVATKAEIISSGINKAQLKRRVKMISNYKKSVPSKQVVLSVILIMAIAITGLTGAQGISAKNASANSALFSGPKTVMPVTGKDAALYWANTLAHRDGAARFAILSNDLKSKEYKNYKELNWSLGGSSPWVTSYSVKENGTTKEGTEFIINYFFGDSTCAKYTGTETVTVKQSGENWFVVQHKGTDDYGYPELSDCKESYDEETFPPALSSILPTKTANGTASLWAEGLKARNGAYRFACLSSDLQNKEYDEYQKKNWLIGTSSPWVTGYTLTSVKSTANDAQYKINYTLTDSTGKVYKNNESITLKNIGGAWYVTKHDAYGSYLE